MRELLGDGYAETLRQVYKDVPETVDYVMYWWHKAAELVRTGKIERFGFITTNSIRQVRQRKVIDFHLRQKNPVRLIFAIPDHPWVVEGAAVRIAMTAGELDDSKKTIRIAQIGTVVAENEGQTPEESADRVEVRSQKAGRIFSNLQAGADVASAILLKSNQKLCCPGMKLHGMGFCLTDVDAKNIESDVVHLYLNGRDLLQNSRNIRVIDLFGFS